MKFTLSWLEKFIDLNASLEEISSTLSKIGFEVEAIVDRSKELELFEVARIIDAHPHPNADKLKICTVKTKGVNLQIVCGAPNARKDINVVLAPVGAIVPNGNFTIKQAKIRDVESNGMLCSAEELLIGKDDGGIIELPDEAVIGEKFAKYFGLDDPMIEIDVTPNRGDVLGVYGIARELAAAGLGTLKPVTLEQEESSLFSLTREPKYDESPNDCPAFASIEVKNITNKMSPLWLQNLLKNIGCTTISAVVDITNYICYSYGRPMHAYDADKLSGNLHVARASSNDTEFHALSDKKYKLTSDHLVVKDDNGAQSLAGIIGGMASSCSENTKNILLEAAIFDKDLIAATGRALAIETDSRFRLERSTDIAVLLPATALAARMVVDICGGEIGKFSLTGSVEFTSNKIALRESDITKATGLNMPIKEAGNILEKLGFTVAYQASSLEAEHPSWRHDISIKEDLIEEIVRIYGFDKVPSVAISTDLEFRLAPAKVVRGNIARRVLASSGYDELVTWSFMNSKYAKLFSPLQDYLTLKNPISIELDYMRPSILPNLLESIVKNRARSFNAGAVFEVGPVFLGTKYDDEKLHASGVRWGHIEANLHSGSREADIFDIKADIESLLLELGSSMENMQLTLDHLPNYYHPSRSTTITLGKNIIGYFGEIHPLILKRYNIDARVIAFELNISAIPESRSKAGRKGAFTASDYQAVTRDFAFLVDRNIHAGKLTKYIASLDKKLIHKVEIFDLYIGDKIDAAKKSVAIRVLMQADDRTLLDAEITSMQQAIISGVEKEFGASLR